MNWPNAWAQGWHPVAYETEVIKGRPLACRLMGTDLVAFRDGGGISVLRDRCPHRGAPLSAGRIIQGTLACPYHGWRFDLDGVCVEIPGSPDRPHHCAERYPVRVAAGLIWTSLSPAPPAFPTLPEAMTESALDRFWWRLPASSANALDALENHLDPAHPHILHPWLVRHPHRRAPVTVELRQGPWGAEALYIEQRRNRALLSGVMEGARARSIGRLWPPSIGEVRLDSARGATLSITVVFVPETAQTTRPYAHFASTRGWLPAWLKRAALKAFHYPVLAQDRRMLARQQQSRGDLRYAIGPLDVMAPAIWRHAEGKLVDEDVRYLELWL